MSKKKKKRTHKIRAVNPATPPSSTSVTSTPNTGYPQTEIRQLKSRLLK